MPDISTAFINTALHCRRDLPYNAMATQKGHVQTTYKSEAMATTSWRSTMPTNLQQCKADRCLWTTAGLGVLIYVDDLLLVGETTQIQQFISTLKATFTLKHVTQSAFLWNLPTTTTCCVLTT